MPYMIFFVFVLMLGLVAISWRRTNPHLHHANHFSFGPIVEVAVVFAGALLRVAGPMIRQVTEDFTA